MCQAERSEIRSGLVIILRIVMKIIIIIIIVSLVIKTTKEKITLEKMCPKFMNIWSGDSDSITWHHWLKERQDLSFFCLVILMTESGVFCEVTIRNGSRLHVSRVTLCHAAVTRPASPGIIITAPSRLIIIINNHYTRYLHILFWTYLEYSSMPSIVKLKSNDLILTITDKNAATVGHTGYHC